LSAYPKVMRSEFKSKNGYPPLINKGHNKTHNYLLLKNPII